MHQLSHVPEAPSVGWPGIIVDKLARQPGADIVVVDGAGVRRHSGAELLQDVNSVVAYLQDASLKPRDRVGIRAPNSYEWIVLDLALMAIGCVSVCVPLEDQQLGTESAHSLIDRLQLSVLFQANPDGTPTRAQPGAVDLTSILRSDRPAIELRTDVDSGAFDTPPDTFTIVFSSGTTGRPKRLPISWPAIEFIIQSLGQEYRLGPADVILDPMPLSILQQRYLVYCAIWHGAKTVLSRHELFLAALERGRPTFMLGSPAFYEVAQRRFDALPQWKRRLMMASSACAGPLPGRLRTWLRARIFGSFHRLYGGRVRTMLVGSAPVPPAMLRFFGRAGFPLYQLYGSTEVGWIAWNSPRANKPGSVGREADPGTVRINEDGEIMISSPRILCRGYEEAEQVAQLQVFPAAHTVATGDLGSFDEEGFLFISGRKKNVIVTRGGRKICPEPMEDQLAALPKIKKAVVLEHPVNGDIAAAVWTHEVAPDIRQLVARSVLHLNKGPFQATPILALAFPNDVLSVESGMLTRNLKVDRAAVWAKIQGNLFALTDLLRGDPKG